MSNGDDCLFMIGECKEIRWTQVTSHPQSVQQIGGIIAENSGFLQLVRVVIVLCIGSIALVWLWDVY